MNAYRIWKWIRFLSINGQFCLPFSLSSLNRGANKWITQQHNFLNATTVKRSHWRSRCHCQLFVHRVCVLQMNISAWYSRIRCIFIENCCKWIIKNTVRRRHKNIREWVSDRKQDEWNAIGVEYTVREWSTTHVHKRDRMCSYVYGRAGARAPLVHLYG